MNVSRTFSLSRYSLDISTYFSISAVTPLQVEQSVPWFCFAISNKKQQSLTKKTKVTACPIYYLVIFDDPDLTCDNQRPSELAIAINIYAGKDCFLKFGSLHHNFFIIIFYYSYFSFIWHCFYCQTSLKLKSTWKWKFLIVPLKCS